MERSLKILPKAKADFVEIFRYISDELLNPEGAIELIKKFERKFSDLIQFPKSYPLVEHESLIKFMLRKCVVDNFLMIYLFNEMNNTIEIIRVVYGRFDYFNDL